MRDYGKVAPQFWTGSTGRLLRGHPTAQIVALYLVTSPTSNMLGLYYLPVPTIAHETGIAAPSVEAALEELRTVGFAVYDFSTETVFVPQMAAYQIGDSLKVNDNRRVAVIRELERVSHDEFRGLFLDRYGPVYNLDVTIFPNGKSHERFPAAVMTFLIEKYENRCAGCKGSGRGPEGVLDPSEGVRTPLHVGHLVAKINGGTSRPENLQLLCASCNSKKSARDRKLFWDNVLEHSPVFESSLSGEGVGKGSARGTHTPSKPGSGSGSESGKKRREAPNPPPPLFALGDPSVPRDRDDLHRKIFDAWISARGKRYPSVRHHEPKLDEERRGAIDAALKLGYSVDKLCQSVVGFVQNADRDCSDPRTFVWALKDSSSIDSGCERWLKANPESQTRMTTVEAAKQAIG
jgi:HNH endonuclease